MFVAVMLCVPRKGRMSNRGTTNKMRCHGACLDRLLQRKNHIHIPSDFSQWHTASTTAISWDQISCDIMAVLVCVIMLYAVCKVTKLYRHIS